MDPGHLPITSGWVIPTLPFGLRYWKAFFDALHLRNHHAIIYTFQAPPDGLESYTTRILPSRAVVRAPSEVDPHGSSILLASPHLYGDIVRDRPDLVVSVEFSLATLWAALACRVIGKKLLVFTEHRPWDALLRSRVRRRWRTLLARFADGFVANTMEARDYLRGQLHVDDRVIISVPVLSPPSCEELQRVPVRLPDVTSRPLFVFAGRLVEGKGVEHLLRAASVLHHEGAPFSLWIVGEGPRRRYLEEQTAMSGLAGVVTFLGQVGYESMGYVYERADVFVMPTLSDYRSVSVLEAMRFGRAIVDSKHDGCASSAVFDGDNGFVVDPEEPPALAGAMRRFVADPSLSRRMGRRSLDILNQNSPADAARRFDEAARSVAALGAGGPGYPSALIREA